MQPKGKKKEYVAKLIIIGDSGVGKTNLLNRICDNRFVPSHMPTIGIDFKFKEIMVDETPIKLQIWDTAVKLFFFKGQERYRTITQTYYKGAMGIILAYSIIDRQSFKNMNNWMAQIKQNCEQNTILVLVGCKADLESERVISTEDGQNYARENGIEFVETSAKTGTNIEECFVNIAKQIKEHNFDGESNTKTSQPAGIQIDNQAATQKQLSEKKGCC